MNKTNRDKSCHCGSGKKHKDCCGLSNVIQMNPQIYNEELSDLRNTLLNYALTNYGQQLIEQQALYNQPLLEKDEKMKEAFLTGLTIWMILSIPITKNKQTIFDVFYKQQKKNIKRTRTKNTFLEWKQASPSVYEIISTDDFERITILDLLTTQTYKVLIIEGINFLKGDILIGTLVPFVGYHSFLADMLEAPSQHKAMIVDHLEKFSQEEGQFSREFPTFLAEIILAEQPGLTWNDDTYEDVAYLFLGHMTDQSIDEDVTSMGIMIWHRYTHLKHPIIKKPIAYAAALEYLVLSTLLSHAHITQKDIAEVYGTTASTISTIYRDIIHSIEEHMDHEKDEIILDLMEDSIDIIPHDHLQEILLKATQTSGSKRKELIEEVLSIDPHNTSAFLLLAEDADSKEAYKNMLQQAMAVGEKSLGKAFFLQNKGNFWSIPETRPYMRAKEMYANYLYHTGDEIEASRHFTALLQLNPKDDQGIRYTLLTLYIECGQFKEAAELIRLFKEDTTATFLFNKVVVDYLINGLTEQTRQFLKDANKQNPFVKDYLVGMKVIPEEIFDYIKLGDETEAITYAQEHIHIWEAIPDLLIELSK